MSYSALVLNPVGRKSLLKSLAPLIPNGWEVVAHHMTIEFPAKSHPLEGAYRLVYPIAFACDGKVCAVKLKGVGIAKESKNETPHITIAVNRAEGGKPVMSNNLTDWQKIPECLIGGFVEICS